MPVLLYTIHELTGFLSDPEKLIQVGGWLIILVVIYMETGFLIGMFLPGGDYTLFTAGLLCGTHVLDIPVFILIPTLALAAFLGDLTGFIKGRWVGPKLFTREKSWLFKPSYLTRTKAFYDKWGIIAFITGKFLPVIRAIIPLMAGASGFARQRFYFFSLLGASLWTTTLTIAGFLIGTKFPHILEYKFTIMFVFILLASLPAARIFLKKKKSSDESSS
ncbi:MAG: VTT domain-containing protein [Bacteroidetes bacterium]|nr:VTT domain-containing protein [Bacteroidota bacterium]